MATVTAKTVKTCPAFPAVDVAAILQRELLTVIRRRYKRKGLALPKGDDEVVIMTVVLDSLTVVEILASLDDVLPFQVTESVVKAGGYESIAAAVKHVTGRVATKWTKHYEGADA